MCHLKLGLSLASIGKKLQNKRGSNFGAPFYFIDLFSFVFILLLLFFVSTLVTFLFEHSYYHKIFFRKQFFLFPDNQFVNISLFYMLAFLLFLVDCFLKS